MSRPNSPPRFGRRVETRPRHQRSVFCRLPDNPEFFTLRYGGLTGGVQVTASQGCRPAGWSLAAACQPGVGTAPVRTSSAATSRSLVLVRWEAWVRMINASSSLILCRSIKMPLACSIQARAIIAVRS